LPILFFMCQYIASVGFKFCHGSSLVSPIDIVEKYDDSAHESESESFIYHAIA